MKPSLPPTLEEIFEKQENQVSPLPRQDFEYFTSVCGFNAKGINPHELVEKRNLPKGALEVIFGKANQRTGYSIRSMKNPIVKARILAIYLLCYSLPDLLES